MKIKDVLDKILDNYYGITVEVFDKISGLIKDRYYIEPHSHDFTNIPENVMEKEVEAIIPYYNGLSICCEE